MCSKRGPYVGLENATAENVTKTETMSGANNIINIPRVIQHVL